MGGARNRARPDVGGNWPGLPARNGARRRRAARDRSGRDSGVRHVVARRAGGEVPDRGTGARAGRSGLQLGVPLPDPIVDARTLAVVITQSGETADTLGALREAKRLGARVDCDLQRRRQHGHARSGRHRLHARRTGDWRRVHEGVHVPARGAASAGDRARPGARVAAARSRARRSSSSSSSCRSASNRRCSWTRRSRRWRRSCSTTAISCTWGAASTTRSRSKARSS